MNRAGQSTTNLKNKQGGSLGIFENDGGPHYGQGSGMLLGLAVGDALGAYLEFEEAREPENYLREYKVGGPHNMPADW